MSSKGSVRQSAKRGGARALGPSRKPPRGKVTKKSAPAGIEVSSDDIVAAVRRGIYKAMRTHIAGGVPMAYADENGVVKHRSVRELKAMLKKAEAEGLV